MKNLIIALLLGAVAGLGAWSLHQQKQISDLRAQLAATGQPAVANAATEKAEPDAKAALEEKTRLLQKHLVAQSEQAARDSQKMSQLEQNLAASKTNSGGLAALFKDPEMKKMIKAQQKVAIGPLLDKMYGDMFKELNLTPEQTKEVKELLEKKLLTASEMGIAMLDGNMDSAERAELSKQVKAETDAADAKIKEVLGEDGYKEYKKYESTVNDRVSLSSFRDQIAGGENALSSAQEKQLIEAMQQERTSFKWTTDPNRFNSNPGDPAFAELFTEDRMSKLFEEQKLLNQQYLARAQSILTPAQFAQYTKFQESQLEMQIAAMKIAAKMFAPKSQ